jgi:thymidylate kinase
MNIIVFSGVDGSGKTTQRNLLQKHLEENGKKVAYFHATEFSLANRLSRALKGKKGFTPGQEKAVSKAGFFSVWLRLFFLSLDTLRFEAYQSKLQKAGCDFLLSDRFFQDSLINICFLSQNFFVRGYAKLLAPLLPKPATTFYLKIGTQDILRRDRVPEQGQEYLEQKIILYNNPPFTWYKQDLVATESSKVIHSHVRSLVGNLY